MQRHDATTATLPLAEAAARLATTPVNVLLHIKRGTLAGIETPTGWAVTTESLARLLASQESGAQRASCRSACTQAAGCGGCRE